MQLVHTLQQLPALRVLKVAPYLDTDLLLPNRPSGVLNFPELLSFTTDIALEALPPLQAPQLEYLEGLSSLSILEELMHGCPRLRTLKKYSIDDDLPDHPPPADQDTAHHLSQAIRGDASSSHVKSSWATTLKVFRVTHLLSALPLVRAIGDCWKALTCLSLRVPANSPPTVARFLIEALPQLNTLDILRGAANLDDQQPVFDFAPSPSVVRPALTHMTLGLLAYDSVLTGLSLPRLSSLKLADVVFNILDLRSLLQIAPALVSLQLQHSSLGGSTDAPHQFSSITSLACNDCDIDAAGLLFLLRALPQLATLCME